MLRFMFPKIYNKEDEWKKKKYVNIAKKIFIEEIKTIGHGRLKDSVITNVGETTN